MVQMTLNIKRQLLRPRGNVLAVVLTNQSAQKNGRESQRKTRPLMFESPKQSGDYFFALAAGFAVAVVTDLAAPAFALVDLAAPAFAFVDFGAGAAGAIFALVDFAVVAFAAVLFAAIPCSSVENFGTDF